MELKVPPNKIENNVIKLRCINAIVKKNKPIRIKLTNFSSCLLVPSYFYDARKFEKYQKTETNKNQPKLEFMNHFELSNNSSCITAIKNSS